MNKSDAKHNEQSNGGDSEYESRLRHRLQILAQELGAGRFMFAPGLQIAEQLNAVRTRPDGSVDLATVSSGVRSLALAAEALVAEREATSVSLAWIQTQYFELLENIFADVAELNKNRQLPPQAVAQFIMERPELVDSVLSQVDAIRNEVNEFWNDREYVVEVHLRDFAGIKAIFGGDVFPSVYQNTPARAAVYADTVVLPDPLQRVLNHLSGAVNRPQLAYQLIKHGLHALSLKDLAFAEIDTPMLVFGPAEGFGSTTPQWWLDSVREDSLFHVNTALGSDFESLAQAEDFLRHIKDASELAAKSLRPDRLLYSADGPADLVSRVRSHLELRKRALRPELGEAISDLVVQDSFGRMGQASSHLYRSHQYQGHPIVDAPTSWRYLQWKLEYDATRREKPAASRLDELVTNALVRYSEFQSAHFGAISVDGLVQLRKSGLIEDLRQQLRDSLEKMQSAGTSDDPAIAEHIVRLFEDGMRQAAQEIERLNTNGTSLAALQVPAFAAATTIAVIGAVGGNYWLTAAAALASQLGLPTAGSIWKKGKDLVDGGRKIAQNPFGVLVSNQLPPG